MQEAFRDERLAAVSRRRCVDGDGGRIARRGRRG